jgi:ATP-dependent Clp protease adaptor protein ClpS
MDTKFAFGQDEQEEVLLMDHIGELSFLIIYNDDVNTFDWVIQSLMDVCKHTHEQSEQLSLLIHFKGKATVKTGPFEALQPLKDALVERGLSAVIESEVAKGK